MSSVGSTHPKLNVASVIVLVVAGSMAVFAALSALRAMRVFTVVYALPIAFGSFALPAALTWAAIYLRRGNYAALMLVFVLAGYTLLTAIVGATIGLRWMYGFWFGGLVLLVQGALLLIAAILATPVLAYFPDPAAAFRAHRRTGIGLRVAAGLTVLARVGVTILLVIPSAMIHGSERFMIIIPIGIVLGVCVAAASISVAMARGVDRSQRPTIGAVIFVAIMAALAICLTHFLRLGFGYSNASPRH